MVRVIRQFISLHPVTSVPTARYHQHHRYQHFRVPRKKGRWLHVRPSLLVYRGFDHRQLHHKCDVADRFHHNGYCELWFRPDPKTTLSRHCSHPTLLLGGNRCWLLLRTSEH